MGEQISFKGFAQIHMSVYVDDTEGLVKGCVYASLYWDRYGMITANHGEALSLSYQVFYKGLHFGEYLISFSFEVSRIKHFEILIEVKPFRAGSSVIGVGS